MTRDALTYLLNYARRMWHVNWTLERRRCTHNETSRFSLVAIITQYTKRKITSIQHKRYNKEQIKSTPKPTFIIVLPG